MKRKKTVELLIKEKIEKELMKTSPNLAREIKKISTSNNNVEVIFHNGSTFVVSPCNDDAKLLAFQIEIFRIITEKENWEAKYKLIIDNIKNNMVK